MPDPTSLTDSPVEVFTVADDEIVWWADGSLHTMDGLSPGTVYELPGADVEVRTLERPGGELLSRFATVNDVHFGETVCGEIEELQSLGPPLLQPEGMDPYPEVMNRAVIREIQEAGIDTVVAKGDLTTNGTYEEYEQFLAHYGEAFGVGLVHVRGNHDSYHGATYASSETQRLDLPGVTLAVLDTARDGLTSGRVSVDQTLWLMQTASEVDRPVMVFGHHHVWDPGSRARPDEYFGVHPDDSERLVDVVAKSPRIIGYFAGHTHRCRVRRFAQTGDVPWVEVACTKDFPGAWAEYRVFEGGVLQIVRRVQDGDAYAWAERTRQMFGGLYPTYAMGELSDRCLGIQHRV